jgi:hypothetical protein
MNQPHGLITADYCARGPVSKILKPSGVATIPEASTPTPRPPPAHPYGRRTLAGTALRRAGLA